jgi:predicted nuclease of predicted toxin-antitoxin system
MKLLLDENLSDRIIPKIRDIYPNSSHVKILQLISTNDSLIWEYAKINDFTIVSKDADFYQRSLVYGHPPKFIYLRVGNCSTSRIISILKTEFNTIAQFIDSELESILFLN